MRPGSATGFLLALAGLLAALIPGCVHSPAGGARENQIRVVGGSLHCARLESTSTVCQAGDAPAYASLLAAFGLAGATPDFEREIAVLVALGERPTLGYQLAPGVSPVVVQEGTAIISLVVHEPPADALVGQAVTSPCLLLALERAGVSVVEARDQQGRLLGRAIVE